MMRAENRFIQIAATLCCATAFFCYLNPASAYESTIKRAPIIPVTDPPQSAGPVEPAGGCLGFGKRIVEQVNSKAQLALNAVDPAKSSIQVFSEIVLTTYTYVRPGPETPFDNDLHIVLGDTIPGLEPDTFVLGATAQIPAVSFGHGTLTLANALAAAGKNDDNGFTKCFPNLVALFKTYDAKAAALNKERHDNSKPPER